MFLTLSCHLVAFIGAALASPWLLWHEARILSKGSPLPPSLLPWAHDQGIAAAQKIRFIRTTPMPLPAPMFIRRMVDKRGFPCLNLAGLSLRRGIYLHPQLPDEITVLKHELIHTRQYQEAGSIFTFLHRYLFQCLTQGYENCDMEREANEGSAPH